MVKIKMENNEEFKEIDLAPDIDIKNLSLEDFEQVEIEEGE